MERIYTVVQMDFNMLDEKLRKVIKLRDELSQALSELNSEGQNIPFLVLKEENPAQSK